MNLKELHDIEKLEKDLWEAADQLRANSKLTSSDYFMPVLGIIFLRHAANRFDAATKQIEKDQKAGKMPKRKVIPADYIKRRSLFLPEEARFDYIIAKATNDDKGLPALLTNAMEAIEQVFEPLQGVLPKDYGIFSGEEKTLEDLMRIFNSDVIKNATGDVFGKIYEYFLANFSIQKAHDNGEFFTPAPIVQTIVNVIEPNHGDILDPACGSGGMFVQSSHFMDESGESTARKVTFYGQEKNPTTIRIAKMNLAVHGLDGKIADAITYYQDEFNLYGKCDFVMANPPFNVDLVDAERVKSDIRLPFGLPGVNKKGTVSNGNYLWISYFYSYLNDTGRAGFVMSSQASSAGHDEKEVRRRIIETGHVDVMISIRSNFFYTRSVPCELWFFDKAKPKQYKDKVLMLDARNIYRKVTRKVYDFSPEQMNNIAAIIWLYRGDTDKYLKLIAHYFENVCEECALIPDELGTFEDTLKELSDIVEKFGKNVQKNGEIEKAKKAEYAEAVQELKTTMDAYIKDRKNLTINLESFHKKTCAKIPADNKGQLKATKAFDPFADSIKGLAKQVDMLFKLIGRCIEMSEKDLAAKDSDSYDVRAVTKKRKELDVQRKSAVEQLKLARYFYKQIQWLQERFPDAKLRDVQGLVKLADLEEIKENDWSLTPGRYVGVAPQEEGEDDGEFEEKLRDIHVELASLNEEAIELAKVIAGNFAELEI